MRNLSRQQFFDSDPEFTAAQLPGMEDLGMKTYADDPDAYDPTELRGTARNYGDPAKPLYRRLGGIQNIEDINTQALGRHWTHDPEWALDPTTDISSRSTGDPRHEYVIEAEHPGRDAIMTWETDKKEMDRFVGPEEYDGAYVPEVPIRGGTPMNIRAIHRLDEWNDPWIRERRSERWTT